MEFKLGDIVILKSGGEVMTVEELSDEYVSCVWHNGKKVELDSFPAIVLRNYAPTLG